MIARDLQAIVLAAGKSSRLKTGKTKLIEKICGQEMVLYPVGLLSSLSIPTTVVVGFQKEIVEKTITKWYPQVSFVHQKELNGTGGAVTCSKDSWNRDHILIINADMPLITQNIIERLYERHMKQNASFSFVTSHATDPSVTYGRVIQENDSVKIIEFKDFQGDDIHEYCCINAGLYLVKREFLEQGLKQLTASSVTHEWYITDLVKIASDAGLKIETMSVPFDSVRGINTFQELWAAEQIKKAEIVKYWMNNGVRFSIAHNVQIDLNVTIGKGSFIDSGVILLEGTHIGKNTRIEAGSIIKNSTVGDNTTIYANTIIHTSKIGAGASVGPFAHVHTKSVIEDKAVVGNFVEVKHSTIGKESKVKHLSYFGDTKAGARMNVGAGAVVCNYDGINKYQTTIEDDVFIGSNNTLVAPITIGKNAFTAAGSTITEDVPAHALAIARERQTNKAGYAKKLKRQEEDEPTVEEEPRPFMAASFASNEGFEHPHD